MKEQRKEEVALWLLSKDPVNGAVQLIGKLLFPHFSNEATRETGEAVVGVEYRCDYVVLPGKQL